jgi:potassium-transporting ATPase KdpC subunit
MLRTHFLVGLKATLLFTVLTGLLYPLAVTGAAQVAFGDKADGSLITKDGEVVGSRLIGQNFTQERYFWSRPSAAGADGYDGGASSGSNKGPTNEEWLKVVEERVTTYRQAQDLAGDTPVPVDAVTASASGLDPNISVANARLQADRVAKVRDLDTETVLQLVDRHTERRALGILGEDGVKVLQLNLALDRLG